jgi:hypothetical protein
VREFVLGGRAYVTPQRNRLEAHTIGICQVLRSWLRAGIIDELDPIFVHVADEAIEQLNDDVAAQRHVGGCGRGRERLGIAS